MDPNIKQSIIDRLKQTSNVLVTVKTNPSVDELAACIGLTLFLNSLDKHATAVFSGEVPSTIEFLKPDDTLEKDTNSLRDFIIALDKSKADKLKYKVEDKIVKIFITPYRTSLSEADLNFSQGDFNVDVVVALGVQGREELDQAIVAHGRILHDATVISVNNTKVADLGALNWNDSKASSLSEMIVGLVEGLKPNSLDAQMATAFLTGIVAETERFSNTKTTSATMSLSAKLMAAGADQQLVAAKLQEPEELPPIEPKPAEQTKDAAVTNSADGTLVIKHIEDDLTNDNINQPKELSELPPPADTSNDPEQKIFIDESGNLKTGLQDKPKPEDSKPEEPKPEDSKPEDSSQEPQKPSRLTLNPPTMGGTLTASGDRQLDQSIDPLSGISPSASLVKESKPDEPLRPPTLRGKNISPYHTLREIEEEVNSSHISETKQSKQQPVLTPSSPSSLPNSEPNLAQILGSKKSISDIESDLNESTKDVDHNSLTDDLENKDKQNKGVDEARKAVEQAANNEQLVREPLQSLNAQPLGADLHPSSDRIQNIDTFKQSALSPSTALSPENGLNNSALPMMPPNLVPPNAELPPEQTAAQNSPTAPPPVPPPMMPPNFN